MLLPTGLSVQLLLFPDSFKNEVPEQVAPQGPQLPKVSVTSKPSEVRQAFDSVKRSASASAASSSSTAARREQQQAAAAPKEE
jgi:hypothetical protein